jgi:large subunit ribosomal protein L25
MATATTKLDVASRDPHGSRSARRLRRTGRIPGVLYGGGSDPVSFSVDARELRLALAGSGAVVDLSIDGAKATPVVLKEAQRDPVRGETTHVDLLRVRLDKPIHAVVPLELTGVEDTPGVKEGGIPESIVHELGELNIGDTLALEAIAVPEGVTLLDDLATTVASVSAPRLQTEEEIELESETELVGDSDGEPGEAAAAGGSSEE